VTALTMPAQPGRDASLRPVPWRGMAWVTWRQHRLTVAGVAAVLGLVSLYLLTTGLHNHDNPAAAYTSRPGFQLAAPLFQVIPALIGAFAGAPALARELETGTFRFTWTQGFGRARWAVATLAPLAITVTVLAGAVGFLFGWCYGPLIYGPDGPSPFAATTFDLLGVPLAAWTLAAFSIGVLAGILIRRVVPAMFATLAAWGGLAAVTGVYLRPHYEAPLVTSNDNLPSTAWVMSQQWLRGGKPASPSTISQILQKAGLNTSGPTTQNPLAPGQSGAPASGSTPAQYLLHHGFTQLTAYQPASRLWPFQWIEGGWLLALSLLLMTAAVWLVHRRAA
jgi:hypothetical protein